MQAYLCASENENQKGCAHLCASENENQKGCAHLCASENENQKGCAHCVHPKMKTKRGCAHLCASENENQKGCAHLCASENENQKGCAHLCASENENQKGCAHLCASENENQKGSGGYKMKDYRIKIKVLNNHMQNAMEERGITSALQLSRESGVTYGTIIGYLNLTKTPFKKDLTPSLPIIKLSEFFNLMIVDLFPKDHLYDALSTNKIEIEASREELTQIEQQPPDELLEKLDLNNAVKEQLETITPREKKVLEMRYGIGCEPCTLEDVGKVFDGISRERVRSIEAKALRKLRHPSRSDELREYLNHENQKGCT